jgi:hypothetical protein
MIKPETVLADACPLALAVFLTDCLPLPVRFKLPTSPGDLLRIKTAFEMLNRSHALGLVDDQIDTVEDLFNIVGMMLSEFTDELPEQRLI